MPNAADKLLRPFRTFYRKISRLLAYVPVIWENEEWDYRYLLDLLDFKLGRMEREQRNDSDHLHADRYADQIKLVRAVLRRIRHEQYAQWMDDEIDAQFGELKIDVNGYLNREKVLTDKQEEEYRKAVKRRQKHEEYLLQQDLAFFWKKFRGHYRDWWT